MKHFTTIALMLVAGSTAALTTGCNCDHNRSATQPEQWSSNSISTTPGSISNLDGDVIAVNAPRYVHGSSYDSNGVRHASSESNLDGDRIAGNTMNRKDGYYDTNGVWRSNTTTPSTTTVAEDRGYYDANGAWQPGSKSNLDGDRLPDAPLTQTSVAQTKEETTGYYDNNGVWQTGMKPAVEDSRVVARTNETRATDGYYDSNGVWRAGSRPVIENRQVTTRSDTRANGGSYDSNGVWQPASKSNLDGDQMIDRSAEQRNPSGYYDSNGAWQNGVRQPEPGDQVALSSGPVVAEGVPAGDMIEVWIAAPTNLDGDPIPNAAPRRVLISRMGYYPVWTNSSRDANGYAENGRASRNGNDATWQNHPNRGDKKKATVDGYYDSNGVWRKH